MSESSYRKGEYYDKKANRKYYNRKKGRATGDFAVYFAFHNFLSMLLFFSIATPLGFFEQKTQVISDVLSVSFLELVLSVFILSFFTGIIARLVAYTTMRVLIVYTHKREMKKFWELNQGINKLSLQYIFSAFISAILFSIGALAILQVLLFDEETLLTLIFTYLLIKIGVYLLVRFFVGAKL